MFREKGNFQIEIMISFFLILTSVVFLVFSVAEETVFEKEIGNGKLFFWEETSDYFFAEDIYDRDELELEEGTTNE